MNKDIMRQAGFSTEIDRVEKGLCPMCEKVVDQEDFRNTLSRKEFEMSGMCQKCQDLTFGG